jgi:polyhydroxyalkanoate synthase
LNDYRNQLLNSLDELSRLTEFKYVDTELLDLEFKGAIAKALKGLSPLEMVLAHLDWASHLALSPGKQLRLLGSLRQKMVALGVFGAKSLLNGSEDGPEQLPRQFSSDAWKRWPFNVLAQGHLLSKSWWKEATRDVDGVTVKHQQLVEFMAQQFLELISPANSLFTNPEAIQVTRKERGRNLLRGFRHLVQDVLPAGLSAKTGDGDFRVGENVAVSPGKVVFQNELIEVIQYSPETAEVAQEPILIVPPWIMKYYILDLSPKNSMVKYLVENGKTVFTISWKNPGADDRDLSFLDYVHKGFFQALEVVNAVCPRRKVNAVGYCLGGTILCIAAAAMARDDDDRLNCISLFASQADFSEAGEITQFISESQLAFLDKFMWKQGYLGIENMGSSFAYLRSSDLVFGPAIERYLKGREASPNDLMSWNADGTRMPYLMHSQYLRSLYLNNDLANNRFDVDGRPVSMGDIRIPLFNLGTETDHVAPWKSVYKINYLTKAETTFCLTSGGHNAGVISGPAHPRRRHRITTQGATDKFVDADSWLENTDIVQGSWWPAWNRWLDDQSSGNRKPPAMGASRKGIKALRDAPGEYVFG